MQLTNTDIASIDKLVNDAGTLIKIPDPMSFLAFEYALQMFHVEGVYTLRCHMNARSYADVRTNHRERFDLVTSRNDLMKGWMCTFPDHDTRIYTTRDVPPEQLYVVGKSSQDMLFVSKVLFDYRRMQDAQRKKW